MNTAHLLEMNARRFPECAAICFEGSAWTYAQLSASAGRLAASLRQLGVERGDRLALFLPNIPAFVLAWHATQRLGAIAVSVSARATAVEVGYVLKDCGAKLLITTAALRSAVDVASTPALQHILIAEGPPDGGLSLELLMAETSECLCAVEVGPDDPAAILYTSGTTGNARGAVLSHGNIVSNAWSFVHNCGMRPGDRILLQLPLFHCFAQNGLMNSGLLAGATLLLQRTFRPDLAAAAIEEHSITMLFAVPTMFLGLLERAAPEQLRTLRYCFSAAASLPPEVERRWLDQFGLIITQGYGLTETSPFASYNHFHQHRPGSIGSPIENVEMKIVDVVTGSELPDGERGEIVIRGPNVMLGYWNRPTETAVALRGGWFHSGDIGHRDSTGYFYLADRLKDMINVGGMNVYPTEVENSLSEHAAVAEAAVFGVPDELMGEQVRGQVVLRPGASVTVADLLDWCRTRLADFKIPRVLQIVSEVPKNPTGKVLKRVLREQAASQTAKPVTTTPAKQYFAAAADQRSRILQSFLGEQLATVLDVAVSEVHPDEPLPDLGLESLMAVDLGVRIRSQLGVDISVTMLMGASLNSLTGVVAAALQQTTGQRHSGT
jgi:long-chain acyl-CoA synthetase